MRALVPMIVVLAAGGSCLGADVGEVTEKLVAAHGKLKSFSAKLEGESRMSTNMESKTKGTFEWMRSGDEVRYRQEVKRVSKHTFDGESFESDEHRILLVDGKFHYQVNADTKNVLKQDFDPGTSESLAPGPFLQQLGYRYDHLKVRAEEKVGKHDCYVIEATGSMFDDDEQDPEDTTINVIRERHWFAKKLGVPIRSEGYDRKGNVVRKRLYTPNKVNEKLDPKRFVLNIEGANVQDHSSAAK